MLPELSINNKTLGGTASVMNGGEAVYSAMVWALTSTGHITASASISDSTIAVIFDCGVMVCRFMVWPPLVACLSVDSISFILFSEP